MNKTDIKQIILEEIESTLQEVEMEAKSAEELAADTFFDSEGMSEEEKGKQGRASNVFDINVEKAAKLSPGFEKMSEEEKKAVIGQFLIRVNNFLETYRPVNIDAETGEKRPSKRLKKRFTIMDLKNLLEVFSKGSFTSRDIIDAVEGYRHPPQANKFLKALENKGLIVLTSGGKKGSSGGSYTPKTDRPKGAFSLSDLGLGEGEDINEMAPVEQLPDLAAIAAFLAVPVSALATMGYAKIKDMIAKKKGQELKEMTNLEKYIRQQIQEAKNPLAKKMKEIENQGRIAALETKLAAIAEMIEETEGRLTRIDEDNEFKEMMDKNAVKEVRKQLKELEKAKGKLEKEKAKLEGKGMKAYKSKEVMDEDLPVEEDSVAEDAIDEDTIENAVDEVELEEDDFKLNESAKRMQKLANIVKG